MELMAPETVPKTEKVSAAMLNALRQSMASLQERDWEDAQQGVYPTELLLSPWGTGPVATAGLVRSAIDLGSRRSAMSRPS